MNTARSVKHILEAGGFVPFLFIGALPELEELTVAIFNTGGFADPHPGEIEEPTIQFMSRSRDYDEGIQILIDIKRKLVGTGPARVGDVLFLSFYNTSGIMELGQDEKQRFKFSLNLRAYAQLM